MLKQISITVIIALVLGLSGCESLNNTSKTPRSATATPRVTLVKNARRNTITALGIAPLNAAKVDDYMSREKADLDKKLDNSNVSVRRHNTDIIISLPGDQSFEAGHAELQSQILPSLMGVAEIINKYPSTYVDIVGHADSSGSESVNLNLSSQRANSTAAYLVSQRVAYQRLFVAGLGSARPIASNGSQKGRALNRRVEIILRPIY